MIDEKKIIDNMPEWLNENHVRNGEYNKGWNKCNKYWIDTIKSLLKKSLWIPCSERMPEDFDLCLVYFEYLSKNNKLLNAYGIGFTVDGEWSPMINYQSGWTNFKIFAWIPIPEYRHSED